MRKIHLFAVALLGLTLIWGCSKGASTTLITTTTSAGDSVASINGVAITAGDLNDSVKNQMQRVEMQIYQIKKQGLDDLIQKKLLEDAAKKSGKSVDEYVKEEIDNKVAQPTEEEVKALYEARKGKDTLPFEKVKGQILEFLKQSKMNKARQDLIAKLKTEADVKVLMEPPRVKLDIEDAPAIGPKDAKVTLVEFSDYQCPFCKRVRQTIWKLTEDYKNDLRYVFMDFPLSFHQFAKKAHEAAHCAGDQDKYFDYNKKIFENQTNLTTDDLKKYAKEMGLNTSKFDKCLDKGEKTKIVEELQEKGMQVGVTGTPAYFINGIQLTGAQPITSFKEIIDEEIKK
jgi:protein-disulfide isomerase